MFKLGDFEGDKSMMLRTDSGEMMSMGGTHFTWRITPQGKLYVGLSAEYLFHVYSENGDLEFDFSRTYVPIPNPKARKGMPKHFSAFDVRRPCFDEEGNLWLELISREEDEGILYDVFTPKGLYLKQVTVPYRIYHFNNNRVYCLLRTEEEFLQVKRVRMEQAPSILEAPF